MQWLNELPFGDNRVFQIGILAACGIAALIVVAIVYRLAFAHRLRVPGGRTRQPRLGLVDAFSLDGQRQLVLVRRDNVEHLVMIGGPNDVLVESHINRSLAPSREKEQVPPPQAPPAPGRRPEAAGVAATPPPPPPLVASSAPPAAPPPVAPVVAGATAAGAAATASSPPAAAGAAAASNPPGPAAAKASEPARPSSFSVVSRPGAPSRSAMPPPIAPASGSPNRGTVTRLAEKSPPNAPPAPPINAAQSASSAAPSARSGKSDTAVAAGKAETHEALAVAAFAAAPAQTTDVEGSEALAPVLTTAGTQPPGESPERTPKGDATSGGNPPPKVADPFANLDTLEAEMARLLGREKLG